MPALQYVYSHYERERGDNTTFPVVNMIVEKGAGDKPIFQSRPGMEEEGTDLGANPVKATFRKDGILSGARFSVAGGSLYSGPTLIGALDGAGPFFIDGWEDLLFIAGGASLWSYNGTTLAAVAFPDSAEVTKVIVGASRAICIREDTQRVYWSDVLTSTVDALNFSEAESQPDRLRDMLFIDDTLILFGAETVEFHPNTGDADLPFQPLQGRVFEVGVRNTGAAAAFGSTFAWVTNHHRVCLQEERGVISDPGLEAKIKASVNCTLFTFFIDGAECLAVRLDDETWVYCARSGFWSKFEYNGGNWNVACWSDDVFGSSGDGKLLQFSDGWQDMGGDLERRLRAGLAITGGALTVDGLLIRCNTGTTTFLSGDYANPSFEVRLSRDGGHTWTAWKERNLGTQGNYRTRPQLHGLGTYGYPGFLCEMRVTDPVDWRVSDILVNEDVV